MAPGPGFACQFIPEQGSVCWRSPGSLWTISDLPKSSGESQLPLAHCLALLMRALNPVHSDQREDQARRTMHSAGALNTISSQPYSSTTLKTETPSCVSLQERSSLQMAGSGYQLFLVPNSLPSCSTMLPLVACGGSLLSLSGAPSSTLGHTSASELHAQLCPRESEPVKCGKIQSAETD